MKKYLVIFVVLVLFGLLGQAYEAASCRSHVEDLKLTGTQAEDEYEKCISF